MRLNYIFQIRLKTNLISKDVKLMYNIDYILFFSYKLINTFFILKFLILTLYTYFKVYKENLIFLIGNLSFETQILNKCQPLNFHINFLQGNLINSFLNKFIH